MKNNIRFDRLAQLAGHLETGKLGHEIFDFSQYNNANAAHCGTAGCAIGECPVLWPEKWEFGFDGYPALVNNLLGTEDCAMQWFGISRRQSWHLFVPKEQDIGAYGGKNLDRHANRYEVAKNIRDFIEKMQQNNEQ